MAVHFYVSLLSVELMADAGSAARFAWLFGFGFAEWRGFGGRKREIRSRKIMQMVCGQFLVSICWSMCYCLNGRGACLVDVEEMGLRGRERRRLSLSFLYIFYHVFKDNCTCSTPLDSFSSKVELNVLCIPFLATVLSAKAADRRNHDFCPPRSKLLGG